MTRERFAGRTLARALPFELRAESSGALLAAGHGELARGLEWRSRCIGIRARIDLVGPKRQPFGARFELGVAVVLAGLCPRFEGAFGDANAAELTAWRLVGRRRAAARLWSVLRQ